MRLNHGLAAINIYKDGMVNSYFINVRLVKNGTKIDFFGDDVLRVRSDRTFIGKDCDATMLKIKELDELELTYLKRARKSINTTREKISLMDKGREELEERFSSLQFCVILDVKDIVTPLSEVFVDYIRDIDLANCSEEEMYKYIDVFQDNTRTVFLLLKDIDVLKEFRVKDESETEGPEADGPEVDDFAGDSPNTKSDENGDKYFIFTLPVMDKQASVILSMREFGGKLLINEQEVIHVVYSDLTDLGLELNCFQTDTTLLKRHNHPAKELFKKTFEEIQTAYNNRELDMNNNIFFLSAVDFFKTTFIYSNNIKGKYKDIFNLELMETEPDLIKSQLLDLHATAKTAYVQAVTNQFIEVKAVADAIVDSGIDIDDHFPKKKTILN